MPTNRSHSKRNQTLIILLGILLAFLLTLNANAFYAADNFHPEDMRKQVIERPQGLSGKVLSGSIDFIKSFAKNLHL